MFYYITTKNLLKFESYLNNSYNIYEFCKAFHWYGIFTKGYMMNLGVYEPPESCSSAQENALFYHENDYKLQLSDTLYSPG